MARPKKYGLDYFPLDVNFYADTKIRRLRARFGNDGVMVYIIILCKIYEQGFYIDYNEDLVLDISDDLNVSENFIRQVVQYLLSRSLLDSKLAMSGQLTSAAIQRRFQGAKRTPVRVNGAYWLLEKEETASLIQLYHNEDKCNNNEGFCNKNPDKCAENKTDKSRVDKSRVDKRERADKPPDLSPINTVVDLFNSICTQMPKVKAVGEKRTAKINGLLKAYDKNTIQAVFLSAHKSDFLNGKNDRGWTATFDWIIVPDNFRKVMEGNYDNRESKMDDTMKSFDLSDIMGLANRFGDI